MASVRVSCQRRTISLWIVGAAILVGGCGGDDAEDDSDHHSDESEVLGTPTAAECPTDSVLSYETFGRDFMADYCVRCHSTELEGTARSGAPEGHDFDVFEGIIAVADHIDQVAAAGPDAVNTMMPPTPPKPTEEERFQLGEWLACEVAAIEAAR